MCIGGRSYPQPPKIELPAAPQLPVTAQPMIQSTPASARDEITYKKKGKRGLTIPRSTSVNVPGA